MKEEVFSPIVKPVGNYCNLRCRYCYHDGAGQDKPKKMSPLLLERFITQYLNLCTDNIGQIIWHGGEPLLAGIDFFKKALAIQKRTHGVRVHNLIQTNATLIDERWVLFFKENHFGVGISLDGGNESHNLYRIDKKGGDTFDTVIRNIELCKRLGLSTGLIQTVARGNIERVEDDWNFFYNTIRHKSWTTSIFHETSSFSGYKPFGVSAEELTEIYKRLIWFWIEKDDEELSISAVDDFVAGIFGYKPKTCTFNGYCGRYFCLDVDGYIYACDHFANKKENVWGNLLDQDLDSIVFGAKANNFRDRVRNKPKQCLECKWVEYCNNGCIFLHNEKGVYVYCETRKKVFEYLENIIDIDKTDRLRRDQNVTRQK